MYKKNYPQRILIVNLLVPVLQITLFCLCIGQPPKQLHIGYVNYDNLGYESGGIKINIGQDIIDEMDHTKVVKVRKIYFNIIYFISFILN